MKSVIICFTIFLLPLYIIAQKKTSDNVPQKNTIYFEVFGQGAFYSFCYDRLYRINRKTKTSASLGLGIIPIYRQYILGLDRQFILSMPASYNFLLGRKNHHFELGMGLTLFFQKRYISPHTIYLYPNGWNPAMPAYSNQTSSFQINYILWVSPKIGYRFQKSEGGIFFRISFDPIVQIIIYNGTIKFKNESEYNQKPSYEIFPYPAVFPWAGVSIGYTLKK